MAKLVFPTAGAPYRGFVGELRGWFNRIASYSEKQPGAATVLRAQLHVLAVKLGYTTPLPANQAIVTNAQKVTGVTGSGTVANIAVSDGVVTGVTLTAS